MLIDFGPCLVPTCTGRLHATDLYTDAGRPVVRCDLCVTEFRIEVMPIEPVVRAPTRELLAPELSAPVYPPFTPPPSAEDVDLFATPPTGDEPFAPPLVDLPPIDPPPADLDLPMAAESHEVPPPDVGAAFARAETTWPGAGTPPDAEP